MDTGSLFGEINVVAESPVTTEFIKWSSHSQVRKQRCRCISETGNRHQNIKTDKMKALPF